MKSSTPSLPEPLNNLMKLNQSIAGSLDEDEILREGLQLEKEILSAEQGSILLLDDSGDYLEFTVALGDEGTVLEDYRVKVGEGVAGYVAEHREPVLVEDASEDSRFAEFFDQQTGFETESLLCVPIQVGEDLLGVAEVINKRDGDTFTSQDLVVFSAFAGQIAVALNNARLHEQLVSRERVEQQLKTARKVQKTYLPDSFPHTNNLGFGAQLEPADRVSGDFFDCFERNNGDFVLMIGDVSGKGMPAALYMCRTLTELRTRFQQGLNPDQVLTEVNRRLVETSTEGMFVTLAVFCVNPQTRHVREASAGHVPTLVRGPNRTETRTSGDNPPLGIVQNHPFTDEEWDLEEESTVVAVTDGILDARDSDGEWFQQQRLTEVVQNSRLPPDLLIRNVFTFVNQFCGSDSKQEDDRTMISFGGQKLNNRFVFCIESHPSYLKLVRDAAAELLGRTGAGDSLINDLQTGLDEAVCNIIEHTYHNRKNGVIEVTLELEEDRFVGSLRDYGPRVNPHDLQETGSSRETPGGLGLQLMREFFDRCEYDPSISDGNRLTLERSLDEVQ